LKKNVTISGVGPPGLVVIDSCDFGFRIWGDISTTVILQNFTLRNCSAAVFSLNGTLKIFHVDFMDNHNSDGGAIYVDNSEFHCEYCRFEKNFATRRGGALYISSSRDIVLTSCQFLNNLVVLDTNLVDYFVGGGAVAILTVRHFDLCNRLSMQSTSGMIDFFVHCHCLEPKLSPDRPAGRAVSEQQCCGTELQCGFGGVGCPRGSTAALWIASSSND
jgi:predicted outer membrane repeat protein